MENFVIDDATIIDPSRGWIISKKLISIVGAEPQGDRMAGFVLQGEDGEMYDMDEFFCAVFDTIEKKLLP